MAREYSPRFAKLVKDAKARIREVTADELKARLDRRESFLLVDVREESEWAQDHLPEAKYLGKGVIERDIESRIPDPDAVIVLYCGGGGRSALVADTLQTMGYTNVASLAGGIRGWREKGYPVTKD
jgi:rhodanese-related sulfurtransferase